MFKFLRRKLQKEVREENKSWYKNRKERLIDIKGIGMIRYGEEMASISNNYTDISKIINFLVVSNLYFP